MRKNRLYYAEFIAKLAFLIRAITLRPEKPYTWASGWKTPIYNDNRKHLGYPENRSLIIEAAETAVVETGTMPDGIIGIPTAGIPWGVMLADALGVPFIAIHNGKAYEFPQYPLEDFPGEIEEALVGSNSPAGIPLGIRVAEAYQKPFLYVRDSGKTHGLENTIEGVYESGQNLAFFAEGFPGEGIGRSYEKNRETLSEAGLSAGHFPMPSLIQERDITGMNLYGYEDLISTGKSYIDVMHKAIELGANAYTVITNFSYGFPVAKQNAEKGGMQIIPLCTYENVLALAKKEKMFSDEHFSLLEEWYHDPEAWSNKYGTRA